MINSPSNNGYDANLHRAAHQRLKEYSAARDAAYAILAYGNPADPQKALVYYKDTLEFYANYAEGYISQYGIPLPDAQQEVGNDT